MDRVLRTAFGMGVVLVAVEVAAPASAATAVFEVTPERGSSFQIGITVDNTMSRYEPAYSVGPSYNKATLRGAFSPVTTPYSSQALAAGGYSEYTSGSLYAEVATETFDGGALRTQAGVFVRINQERFDGRDYVAGGPSFYYRYSILNINAYDGTVPSVDRPLSLQEFASIFANQSFRYSEFGSNQLCAGEQDPSCALISNYAVSGTARFLRLDAPAVPEPATWAMLLIGFGMIGAASRYSRRSTATTFA